MGESSSRSRQGDGIVGKGRKVLGRKSEIICKVRVVGTLKLHRARRTEVTDPASRGPCQKPQKRDARALEEAVMDGANGPNKKFE